MDSILTLIKQWKDKFDSVVENGEQSGGASVLEIEADRLLSRASVDIENLSGQSLERFYKGERLEIERDALVEWGKRVMLNYEVNEFEDSFADLLTEYKED